MTYANLTDLRTDLIRTMEEDGTEYAENLNNIINKGHAYVLRRLDSKAFNKTVPVSVNIASQFVSVPPDELITRSLTHVRPDGSLYYLDMRPPDFLDVYWPNPNTTGQPKYFSKISQTTYKVAPTPAQNGVIHVYYDYEMPSPTVASTPTWLMQRGERALFAACMMDSYLWAKDEERAALWKQNADDELATLLNEGRRQRRVDAQEPAGSTENNIRKGAE